MASTQREKLLEVLRTASADLPDVIEKKMFGCEALFTTGGIFALLWKTGRIGLKLTDEKRYAALASQKGAEPWAPGAKVMRGWVLVAPKLEEPKALAPWLAEAHAMASDVKSATSKPKKKTVAKKSTPKKRARA